MRAPFLISVFDMNLTLGVTVGSSSHGEIVMERRREKGQFASSSFFLTLPALLQLLMPLVLYSSSTRWRST